MPKSKHKRRSHRVLPVDSEAGKKELALSGNEEDTDEGSPPRTWTYDETINYIGLGRFHCVLLLVCGWANASDAVEVLCVSLILTSLQCDMNVSSQAIGWLTAVVFIGMMFGGYMWGSIGDFSGRKRVMVAALFVNGIFGLASAFAQNFWLFFFLRFMSGLGVGGSIPVIWSYFCEFQPSHVRGRMLSVIATFWMIGTMLTSGIAWILIPHAEWTFMLGGMEFPPWRSFIVLSTFLCLSSSLLCAFLPESPKFLIRVSRVEDEAEGEGGEGGWRTILSQTAQLFHKPLLVTTLAMLLINFSLSFGSYGLTFWLPELFTRARESGTSGPICSHGDLNHTSSDVLNCTHTPAPSVFRDTFLVALSSLPGNLLTIIFLDRWGRKPFFVVGGVLSALSVFMIWFVSNQLQVLLMSCIFSATSVLCWNCLDAFSTELFPTHLRATSMGACLAVARIGAILGNLAFGALIDTHCAIPILMVAAMLALGSLTSLKLKETAQVPLG